MLFPILILLFGLLMLWAGYMLGRSDGHLETRQLLEELCSENK